MTHMACRGMKEVPYCFSMSLITFQGHIGRKINDLDMILGKIIRPVTALQSLSFVLFPSCHWNPLDQILVWTYSHTHKYVYIKGLVQDCGNWCVCNRFTVNLHQVIEMKIYVYTDLYTIFYSRCSLQYGVSILQHSQTAMGTKLLYDVSCKLDAHLKVIALKSIRWICQWMVNNLLPITGLWNVFEAFVAFLPCSLVNFFANSILTKYVQHSV